MSETTTKSNPIYKNKWVWIVGVIIIALIYNVFEPESMKLERARKEFVRDSIALVEKTAKEEAKRLEERSGSRYEAVAMAEKFVKERLKSPSSAEFSNTKHVYSKKTNRWLISGKVDSQNAFGAMIRSDFNVVLTKKSNDTWSAISVSIE